MDPKERIKVLADVGDTMVGDVIGGEEVLGAELATEYGDTTLLVRTDTKIYRLTVTLHTALT